MPMQIKYYKSTWNQGIFHSNKHHSYQLLRTSQDVASSLKSSWSLIRFTTEMLCMVYLKLELTLNLCQSFWMIGMAKIFAMFLRFALAPNRSLNNCSCSRL